MEIGVKFKPNTSYDDKYSILPLINGREEDSIGNDVLIIYTPMTNYDEISNILLSLPFIEQIEQPVERSFNFIPSEALFPQQWHLANTSVGMGVETLWANNITGNGTYVVNTDTGCFHHEDLIDNFGIVPNETLVGRVDSNGNGYKNDYYGWNFYTGNNCLFYNVPPYTYVYNGVTYTSQPTTHGTNTSGVIAAKGNGIGVCGVAPDAKIITAVILDNRGKFVDSFAAAKAINYAVSLKASGLNIVAINMSWGGLGTSFVEGSAISEANTAGILCVCAAGNSTANTDTTPHYPSCLSYPNIISVGAIDSTGAIATYSNYGATTVDLFAPGSGILTTHTTGYGQAATSAYAFCNGTSFAAPCVSGAIALYKSKYPSKTAAEVKAAILNNVTVSSTYSGKCVTGGRLNVRNF
jgi:subtilisin family serine protease